MYCPKCGNDMGQSVQCNSCGFTTNGRQQQSENMGGTMSGSGYRSNENHPKFTSSLIWGIVQFFCCCWITGGLMILFNILANTAYKSGDMRGYESNCKVIKVSMIIGFILAGLVYGIYILSMVIGVLAGAY